MVVLGFQLPSPTLFGLTTYIVCGSLRGKNFIIANLVLFLHSGHSSTVPAQQQQKKQQETVKNSHKTPSHNNPIKQKSKSRSSSREPSSSRSKSSLRKRVSFDDTPVEISRETSLSKISSNHSNNELVPNGIHLNHHHHQVLAKLHRNSRNFFLSFCFRDLYKIVSNCCNVAYFEKKKIGRVDNDLYYLCLCKMYSKVDYVFYIIKCWTHILFL